MPLPYLPILYENHTILLCEKPANVLSQPSPGEAVSMLSLLREQTGSDIYPIHRLDREVAGVMVFAKTEKAAAILSKAVSQRTLVKEYLAVVEGCPPEPQGEMKDLLFKDSTRGKTFVVSRMRKGVKDASLSYEVLASRENTSLVRVLLHTGRTHQIRVQFASRKMPLLGDRKYGSSCSGDIALYSFHLSCMQPKFDITSLPKQGYFLPYQDVIDSLLP